MPPLKSSQANIGGGGCLFLRVCDFGFFFNKRSLQMIARIEKLIKYPTSIGRKITVIFFFSLKQSLKITNI